MKGTLVIRNATVWTVGPDGILEGGDILVRNGRIEAVGRVGEVGAHIPAVEAERKIVTPGLIDCHTHLGLWEEGCPLEESSGNEKASSLTPHLRALDGFDPEDSSFLDARRSGITTVQILPGSANVIGGQSVVVRTAGVNADRMVRLQPAGMKAAFGQNPKNIHKEWKVMPTTRMSTAAMLRSTLVKAANYGEKLEREGDRADRDLELEGVLAVLRREMPLRIHAHRADDILTAIRVAEEFSLHYTIEHCTEGNKIADVLGEKRLQVAFGPFLIFKSKLELKNCSVDNVVPIYRAGARVSLITDYPMIPVSSLMLQAGRVVRAGIPRDEVFRFVTINPAEHLGMEREIGSIEPGKRGDLVLWDGDPFDYTTSVEMTLIDGETVYRDEKAR